MGQNVHLGDGVLDEVKTHANSRMKDVGKSFIDDFFDWIVDELKDGLKDNAKDWLERIKHLRNSPKTEQQVVALWSKYLFEEGLAPKAYMGLPDNLLISNFHQEGYLDGLYAGYVLAMMALVDNNISKDVILAVRDYIRPNLMGHHYDDREEFLSQYKDEKYCWIDRSRELSSDI